jgi:hypothetical protein
MCCRRPESGENAPWFGAAQSPSNEPKEIEYTRIDSSDGAGAVIAHEVTYGPYGIIDMAPVAPEGTCPPLARMEIDKFERPDARRQPWLADMGQC